MEYSPQKGGSAWVRVFIILQYFLYVNKNKQNKMFIILSNNIDITSLKFHIII